MSVSAETETIEKLRKNDSGARRGSGDLSGSTEEPETRDNTPPSVVLGSSVSGTTSQRSLLFRGASQLGIANGVTTSHRLSLNLVAVDPNKLCASSRQRLGDLCGLVRNLFWAFEEVESYAGIPKSVHRQHGSWRRAASRVVQGEVFSGFFMFLTFYALFGPDFALMLGHSPHNQEDRTLAAINTVVLGLFVMEGLLSCWVLDGYVCSGRFWIDCFATVSIVGDTWIGGEIVQSDAAVAGRGTRLTRLVRIGGRSGRVMRMFRISRAMQVLKLIPKLQRWMERSTQDLANLLWHKRLWHIFQFLDRGKSGRLTEEDLNFFSEAMEREFPDKQDGATSNGLSVWMSESIATFKNKFKGAVKVEPANSGVYCDGTYASLVREYRVMPAARRSFTRCLDDIHCMKDSCAIVERAIGRLTLKVCLLLLSLLIGGELMAPSTDDYSNLENLQTLDSLAGDAPTMGYTWPPQPELICGQLVDHYSKLPDSGDLLLAIVGGRSYWRPQCHCCDPLTAVDAPLQKSPLDLAEDVMKAADKESHELSLLYICVDNQASGVFVVDCEDDSARYTYRTLVVFTNHDELRTKAGRDLLFTSTIVVLLLNMVLYFATDMKKLSNATVLHPLWVLMDDMCALKSMDVLTEKVHTEDMNQYLGKNYCCKLRGKTIACQGGAFPVAEEIKQLRGTFEKLRAAMLSWSKYVPVPLLKQLLAAGVEANVGCTQRDVSIIFCDIHDFKEIVKDMKPIAVLELLSVVFGRIYDALENNGGTMLEFIGDEVLAVFNAPLDIEGHNRCAVTAALDAKEGLDRTQHTGTSSTVRIQCAVHRATVLAGNIGSPTRMKYGMLGDGVNTCARLKSLNTRYGTHMLVSGGAMDFPDADRDYLTRPIGNLVLKGRTTPTMVYELMAKRATAPDRLIRGADKHKLGFQHFAEGRFAEARALLTEAHGFLSGPPIAGDRSGDRPSQHLISLCEHFLVSPPGPGWDGSEHLTKKAW